MSDTGDFQSLPRRSKSLENRLFGNGHTWQFSLANKIRRDERIKSPSVSLALDIVEQYFYGLSRTPAFSDNFLFSLQVRDSTNLLYLGRSYRRLKRNPRDH